MTVEDWGVAIITLAAIAVNLFVVLYAVFAPWYRSVFGRALMTGEVAFSVLVDLSLYVHWSKTVLPPWVPLVVYSLIAVGCWMRLGAVIHEQILKRD